MPSESGAADALNSFEKHLHRRKIRTYVYEIRKTQEKYNDKYTNAAATENEMQTISCSVLSLTANKY